MDPRVDPCEDFHGYACGGLQKKASIPEASSGISPFGSVKKDLADKLLKLLKEGENKKPGDPRVFREAKKLYASCMDNQTLNRLGLKPLQRLLGRIGGWPLLEEGGGGGSWRGLNKGTYEWYRVVPKLKTLGVHQGGILIEIDVLPDVLNSSRRVLSLNKPAFGIEERYLLHGMENKVIQGYLNVMIQSASRLGASGNESRAQLLQVLDFEIKLASLAMSQTEKGNFTSDYHPMHLRDLRSLGPTIPWLGLFNEILAPLTITENETIIVQSPNYIREFNRLIQGTPRRTISNYVGWRVVFASLDLLDSPMADILFRFEQIQSGRKSIVERESQCIHYIENLLPSIVGSMYVRRYVGEKDRVEAEVIMEYMRRQFRALLYETEWMDNGTKMEAMRKLESMKDEIGYPVELLDDRKLEERFGYLSFDVGDFLGNVLSVTSTEWAHKVGQLREKVNKTHWDSLPSPTLANALYDRPRNLMIFPAAILNGVFFMRGRPNYLNLGSFGWMVGHEMTHGFDSEGSEYDQDGNVRNWWTEGSKKKFMGKTECLWDQYDDYSSPELIVDGELTLAENIADNGGLKVAYYAYVNSLQNITEPLLPGLNLSPRQLFWLNAANLWCSKTRASLKTHASLTDEHAPDRFRILGSFSNQPEFSADFNCRPGSLMNPSRKCSVW